ncbi:MAG: amidohydrolase family protein [Myxococcota bacterium]
MRPISPVLAFQILALAASLLSCATNVETASVSYPARPVNELLIRDVDVLEVERGVVETSLDVVVRRGRIAAIEKGGTIPSDGLLVIDGSGATLLPGLIDMHGHVSLSRSPFWELEGADPLANMQSYLYAGVTTVFDPADVDTKAAVARREAVRRGELVGPAILTTGQMVTCPGGHPVAVRELFAPWWISWLLTSGIAHEVQTRSEARSAIDDLHSAGVDAIKVAVDRIPPRAPRISLETMAAIDERTNELGLRWVSHIGSLQDALDAGEAGTDLWVHGVSREPLSDADVQRLAAFEIPMVVTIEVMHRVVSVVSRPIDPIPMEIETVPRAVIESFYPPPAEFVDALREFRSIGGPREGDLDVLGIGQRNMMKLHRAGVTILAGTDPQGAGVFPGAALHRELAHFVDAGMTPAEAIRSATLDSARWIADGAPIDFGAVRVGLQADLLLVRGDPTDDIRRLQDIVEVIVDGTPVRREPVHQTSRGKRGRIGPWGRDSCRSVPPCAALCRPDGVTH